MQRVWCDEGNGVTPGLRNAPASDSDVILLEINPLVIFSSDDEDSDNEVEGMDVEGAKSDEDATYVEDQGNEAVEDTNANLEGRDDRSSVSFWTSSPIIAESKNQIPGLMLYVGQSAEATLSIDILALHCGAIPSLHNHRLIPDKQQFLDSIDEGRMKKVLKEQVTKRSLKDHSKIEKLVIRQLESEVSDIQRQLYKALVDAYEADKILLDTYGDTKDLRAQLNVESRDRVNDDKVRTHEGISHWGKSEGTILCIADQRESARDVYSKRRIIAVTKVEIVEWQNYKHLD
ncbi:hypothetical protein Tco_0846976 [Tanacetum coccineum]